jgi:IS30 family transposase
MTLKQQALEERRVTIRRLRAQEKSIAEIAAIVGWSPATVRRELAPPKVQHVPGQLDLFGDGSS